MRETRVSQNSQPLVLVPSRRNALLNPLSTEYPRRNHFVTYLLSISFVGLLVRFFRVTHHILSFLVAVMNSKTIAEKAKVTGVQPQPHIVSIQDEPHIESYTQNNEHEAELKEHFLTMASHELKTPMTTITGQAQLALRRISRMPELSAELVSMRSALESIDGQARRLNALVNDMLDLHNIRSGKVPLRLVPCNLVDLCREAIEEQQQLTGRAIVLEATADTVQIYADADRLYQVVVNLVCNALRYSPDESQVKVGVYQQRDIGIIEVQDNGTGIPSEQQTHIFEPFYRGSEEQLSSKCGLGLGLAICKDVVERHRGRIWCRSRLGKGSTFIVELPTNKRTTEKL